MRKITFFFALMVTMVTTAFAQTVVSNLSDFKSDKCYTVTTPSRGGWAVKSDASQFCSTNDAGLGTTSNATDANQQFAVLTVNGEDYFLYSVGAKKFIKHDRTLSAVSGDAIEFADASKEGVGRVRVNFKGIENSYINLGGSNQMTVDWWGTIDAGNAVQFLEVADFDATEALKLLNSKVELVYVYQYEGKEISRQTVDVMVGEAYPAITAPYGFTADAPQGVVEAAGEKVVECTFAGYPFEYAETVDAIDTWYYIQMHSNDKRYIQYVEGENSIEWLDAEVAEGEENSHIWAFVGAPATGFKLVNYAATVEKALCGNGEGNPAMDAFADGINWVAAASDVVGEAFFCLQYPNGKYMNAQNGKVAYWTDNDAGSTFMLTVAEPVVATPELEALEATNATRNPAESDWDPSKSYYLQGVKLDFAEAVKKADGVKEFGCVYNANGEQVAVLDKILGANGTAKYATPYVATKITTAGTYKVVIYSGVILSADGTKEYKGGEFEFSVAKKPATLIPSAEDGLFYNASFTSVEEFKTQQIIVSGAEEVTVSEEVKITMTSGETVYTAAVTVEEMNGNKVINIVFPDEDYAAGRYTINIPAGAFLVDGVANAEYYASNFTYSKPQLKVTKDWTSWEALFTEKYMMPREVAIAINNAEAVTVAENMVATLTVGETTYNSTVSFTNEENNYWISFKFAEIEAIYENEEADFVKGEYTFTVPAGLYTVNGEANVEETRTFTYGDVVVNEFSVTSISPAVGDVTELNRIEIAFSNNTKPEQLILTNGDERFFFIAKDGAYVAVDPLKDYAEITITELGTYTLDLSELEGLTGDKVFSWTVVEPVANTFVPSSYESTNKFVPSMLQGIKIWFDEKVASVELAEGETSFGYILNAAGERVLELDKKSTVNGNLKYVSLTNADYEAVETAGEYTVVVTAVITSESGTVHTYGEFKFTVEKAPVEVSRDVEFWGTVESIPAEINLTINNADAIVLDETKKATLTCGETVYEATATLNDNVITLAFSEEFVEGEYTFVIPAGLYTTDGEAGEEVYEEFTFKKPVPLKIIAIEPAVGEVEKIEYITIQFNQPVEASYMLEMNGYALMKSGWQASETVTYMVLDANYEETVISTPGEYTINIADVTEMPLAEGEAATYTWTVVEPAPEPLAVVSQTPAADEVVESFSAITIEFNKAIEFIQAAGGTGTGTGTGTSGPVQFIKLKDANGGVAATAWVSAATIDGNKVTFVFEMNASISKTGVYSFAIPAGLIKATDGEEFAGDTFTFEVAVPEGIESVDAEVENDVIYDLSGRRIAEIVKPGIYIVNGKKVLVK